MFTMRLPFLQILMPEQNGLVRFTRYKIKDGVEVTGLSLRLLSQVLFIAFHYSISCFFSGSEYIIMSCGAR